jgi:DNA-binding Xre family transcriptional regulator
MKKGKNTINTGKMLEDHLRKNRVNRTDLASKINRTGQSITKYGQNDSIQTAILLDICHALGHNFFQDIANTLPQDFEVNPELNSANQQLILQLQEENKVLRIQNELLMKLKG